jgi:hypothetical protein
MSKPKQSIPPAPQYPQQYPQQQQQYQQQPQYPQQQGQQNQYPAIGYFGGAPEPKKKGFPWWAWLLIAFAVIILIGSVINASKPSTTATATAQAVQQGAVPTRAIQSTLQTTAPVAAAPTTATGPKIGKIGETQSVSGYLVTVNGVQKSDNFTQGDYGKAKAGNTFIAVDLTVGSSKDSGVDPNGLSASIKDSQGFKYSIAVIGYKEPLLPGQNDLANGDKVRGWVTFEVPKTASGLVLEYTPLFETGTVRVALG